MKMHNFKFAGLAAAVALMSTLSINDSTAADRHAHALHAKMITVQDDFSGISEDKGRQLLTKYLEIKDAHVASDGETASKLAGEMAAIFDGTETGKASQELRADVAKIAGTTDVDQQRNHFKTLSTNMYKLAKAVDLQEGELYYQHCPMAFNNQGASWLSAEKEVRNPYFGDKMLKCGRVKETIQ